VERVSAAFEAMLPAPTKRSALRRYVTLPMSATGPARARTLSRILSVAIAAVVFVGDQATKALVEHHIPEYAVIPVVPGFFNLTHTKNAGAVFGLFSESPATWKTGLLIVVSTALLITVVGIVLRTRRLGWETSLGLALTLGGALSNLLDRIRVGRVVDFLDFYFRSYHWASFNVADSAIVVGAGFLILQVLFSH
jgi:signal peptidase II